jgi:hypothetical protein
MANAHWIASVVQDYKVIQTAYFDGTQTAAIKHFKKEPAIKRYFKSGYVVSMQPNAIVIWDGWLADQKMKILDDAKRKRNPKMRKKRRTAKQIAATKKLVAFNKRRRKGNPKKRVTRRRKVAKKKIATRTRRTTAKTRTRDYVIFKCNGSSVHYLSLSTSGKKTWTASRERALHWTGKKVAQGIAKKTRSATGVAASSSSKSAIASFCRTGK